MKKFVLIALMLCVGLACSADAAVWRSDDAKFGNKDPMLDLGRNQFSTAVTEVNISGYNGDADFTGGVVPTWGTIGDGDSAYSFIPAAEGGHTMQFAGTAATDTASGTGAHTVTIYGLNAAFASISEDVACLGATTATTTLAFYRVNGAYVKNAGTGVTNAGALTIRDALSGRRQAVIPASKSVARNGVYTVAVGETLYVRTVGFGDSIAEGAEFQVRYRDYSSSTTGVWLLAKPLCLATAGGGYVSKKLYAPYSFAAKTDVQMIVGQQVTGNAVVTGDLSGWTE